MKSHSEMKQHIIEQAKLFHSKDAEDIDVEGELTLDIIEFALNGNYIIGDDKKLLQKLLDEDGKIINNGIVIKEMDTSEKRDKLYYDLIRKGKVPNEIVELEKLFMKEFFEEDDLDEFIEALKDGGYFDDISIESYL